MQDRHDLLTAAATALDHPSPLLDRAELEAFVDSFLQRRQVFLDARRRHGSPLYVLEPQVLRDRAEQLVSTFRDELPEVSAYYAVKSNNCPLVASALVDSGLGLDVSSGLEWELALDCGAQEILFSGPGKTEAELHLAVAHRDWVTVLVDSFAELELLERTAGAARASVRAGVRLTTNERGLWRKFGILLADLPRFLARAEECRHVVVGGLQFHTSWNMGPDNQVAFLQRLGAALQDLPAGHRAQLGFLDIGGGFWPPQGEWLQPAGTPEGKLREAVRPEAEPVAPSLAPHRFPARPLQDFAREIAAALRTHVFPHLDCRVCLEPGRWLCNDAMHLLLTVLDRKADDLVITDGGINAVGWERFETDYFPVLNLSRPSLEEHECYVMGSLCTPHDLRNTNYFGTDLQPGDVLLIPTQGAYTYSLRQEFIKPLPQVVSV